MLTFASGSQHVSLPPIGISDESEKMISEFVAEHKFPIVAQKTMVEICFESGFGNLSHFNKQFKQWMKVPPLQYRKMTQEWV